MLLFKLSNFYQLDVRNKSYIALANWVEIWTSHGLLKINGSASLFISILNT